MGDLIWLDNDLAPGPDYRLYLNNTLITSKQVFLDVKNQAIQIAQVKVFKNYQWICKMAVLFMIIML